MLRRWAWSKGLAGTLSQKTNRLSAPISFQDCCFEVKQLPYKQSYLHGYAGSIPAHLMHIMPGCARLTPIISEPRTSQIRVSDCQNERTAIKRSPNNHTPTPPLRNHMVRDIDPIRSKSNIRVKPSCCAPKNLASSWMRVPSSHGQQHKCIETTQTTHAFLENSCYCPNNDNYPQGRGIQRRSAEWLSQTPLCTFVSVPRPYPPSKDKEVV